MTKEMLLLTYKVFSNKKKELEYLMKIFRQELDIYTKYNIEVEISRKELEKVGSDSSVDKAYNFLVKDSNVIKKRIEQTNEKLAQLDSQLSIMVSKLEKVEKQLEERHLDVEISAEEPKVEDNILEEKPVIKENTRRKSRSALYEDLSDYQPESNELVEDVRKDISTDIPIVEEKHKNPIRIVPIKVRQAEVLGIISIISKIAANEFKIKKYNIREVA